MSQLFYIRHGQASFGKPDYDQLSDLGYQQSNILGSHFGEKNIEIHEIYVGPLKRHRQTLESFIEGFQGNGKNLPKAQILPELDEHRGPEILKRAMPYLLESDEQIRIWQKLIQDNPHQKSKYGLLIFDRAMELWADGSLTDHQPPEFDTWPVFRKSVSTGFDKVLEKHRTQRGQNILLFTSGGTISAIIGRLMNIESHTKVIQLNGIVQNASYTEVLFNEDKYTLKSFNKVPHLSTEMLTYV